MIVADDVVDIAVPLHVDRVKRVTVLVDDTIRYKPIPTVYLTCSKKLTDRQLSHAMNKKM